MKTLLHVGCGFLNISSLPSYFQDGLWHEIRYDINEAVRPDVLGSLFDMSIIEDGSVDAIYSSHNIEHVWSFEVPLVVSEFYRVLADSGIAIILCPDILSVAQALTQVSPVHTLYESPAGPITALDILYGYQNDVRAGNLFMAHKTAFTAETLAISVLSAGFAGCIVFRDRNFGLHCLATKMPQNSLEIARMKASIFPSEVNSLGVSHFGCYQDAVL